MKLSAVILSRTNSQAVFEMTCECIQTLKDSEEHIEMEIIVVESNKDYERSDFRYPDFVKIIIPEAAFNFHRFLNIGMHASTGEYIAFCNNDLIFYDHWFTEILKVADQHPKIKSFSPNGNFTANFVSDFQTGYKVRTHVFGWCFITKRTVFKTTGDLDETFDFNYADNDYAMTLKKYNIMHAVVYKSKVKHLDPKEVNIDKGDWYQIQQEKAAKSIQELPDYVAAADAFTDKKSLQDHLKFHTKWGSPKKLYRKNKIADFFIKYHLGFLNRWIMTA